MIIIDKSYELLKIWPLEDKILSTAILTLKLTLKLTFGEDIERLYRIS